MKAFLINDLQQDEYPISDNQHRRRKARRRRGQTLIFFIMTLVILFFVALWNFDLHKILYVKSISQNAGDAAALMAARWQGITLNLIGDLNIMRALALGSDDAETASAITNIQARLCYVGPMIALMGAQQAAKNNGIYARQGFTDRLFDHARKVRNDYPTAVGQNGEPLFPEPYPGAWDEYADMLETIAQDGVAAGPDNVRYYDDYTGGHYLLMIDFYEAIAGRTWCWFYNNAPELLADYQNFLPCWWPPLPEIPPTQHINSEIFGLGLLKKNAALSDIADFDTVVSVAAARGFDSPSGQAMEVATDWYCYDTEAWSFWDAMSVSGDDPFPIVGKVKPEYDYAGADAAVRIETTTDRLTPGPKGSVVSNTITWTAAAKPFGFLNENERPNAYDLVLPAFHEVRLIPVDASSAPSGGGYNLEWREHIEQHLPDYMQNGPQQRSCWYCNQLLTWEDSAFRQSGEGWLSTNSYLCTLPGGGGGGGGGGRRRGH